MKNKKIISEWLKRAKSNILTDYTVNTRHPGIYEPVSEEE